jgi:hypothetical protein
VFTIIHSSKTNVSSAVICVLFVTHMAARDPHATRHRGDASMWRSSMMNTTRQTHERDLHLHVHTFLTRVLVCPVRLSRTYTWPLATCLLRRTYNIHIVTKKCLCIRKFSKKTLIESKKYELARDVDTLVLARLSPFASLQRRPASREEKEE